MQKMRMKLMCRAILLTLILVNQVACAATDDSGGASEGDASWITGEGGACAATDDSEGVSDTIGIRLNEARFVGLITIRLIECRESACTISVTYGRSTSSPTIELYLVPYDRWLINLGQSRTAEIRLLRARDGFAQMNIEIPPVWPYEKCCANH